MEALKTKNHTFIKVKEFVKAQEEVKVQVKKKKWLMPAVSVILASGFLFGLTFFAAKGRTAGAYASQGDRQLEDGRYEEALASYGRALTSDNENLQARLGVAEIYFRRGDPDFAIEMLYALYESSSDEAVLEKMVEIFAEGSNTEEAIAIINRLIEHTDASKYYEMRDELAAKIYAAGQLESAGTDHSGRVSAAAVIFSGRNDHGQMGQYTDSEAGEQTPKLSTVQVSFVPKSIYCGRYVTFVIDRTDRLWATGNNVFGQLGRGHKRLEAQTGFVRIEGISDVVSVAAGSSHAVVLTKSGDVYGLGANSDGQIGCSERVKTADSPMKIASLSQVLKVDAAGSYTLYLCTNGRLYYSGLLPGAAEKAAVPTLLAQNVIRMACSSNYAVYQDESGILYTVGTPPAVKLPREYGYNAADYQPKITLSVPARQLEACANGIIWVDSNGMLNIAQASGTSVIEHLGQVQSIDASDSRMILRTLSGDIYEGSYNYDKAAFEFKEM